MTRMAYGLRLASLTAYGFFILAVSCLPLAVDCYADSLWKDGSSSPYTQEKAFKLGDIVTILVLESTSAVHKAGTNTSLQDEFGAKFNHSINRLTSLIPSSVTMSGDNSNKYTGTGKTERSSNLTAKVAAVITELLPNGTLRIAGKHKVEVNDEVQEISVAGIVRSKDITISNTVYSYQVADAEILVKGTGVVEDAQSPGWFTRFLNWLF